MSRRDARRRPPAGAGVARPPPAHSTGSRDTPGPRLRTPTARAGRVRAVPDAHVWGMPTPRAFRSVDGAPDASAIALPGATFPVDGRRRSVAPGSRPVGPRAPGSGAASLRVAPDGATRARSVRAWAGGGVRPGRR